MNDLDQMSETAEAVFDVVLALVIGIALAAALAHGLGVLTQ